MTFEGRVELLALPQSEWKATKTTLHLWLQIVGKIRMASTATRNHWWHTSLYVDVRGLTTRRSHGAGGVIFEIAVDFVDHELVVSTNRGEVESFDLRDGLSVAAFDQKLHATLARLGIDVQIRESPYGVPMTTPFPEDDLLGRRREDARAELLLLRLARATRHALTAASTRRGLLGGRGEPARPSSLRERQDGRRPPITLLAFLESAYRAGARGPGWNRNELASSWAPPVRLS
ncbi:MAG: DUF5996 family protein [Gaiellaceae bacterium]